MNIKLIRTLLLGAIALVALILYTKWQTEFHPVATSSQQDPAQTQETISHSTVPTFSGDHVTTSVATTDTPTIAPNHLITVITPKMIVRINPKGGDIVSVQLKDYSVALDNKTPISLLTTNPQTTYLSQSGITHLPSGENTLYQSDVKALTVTQGEKKLVLTAEVKGLQLTKTFTFHADSYQIPLQFQVKNNGHAAWDGAFFAQLLRKPVMAHEMGFIGSYTTYTGAAISYPGNHYSKQSFSNIEDSPVNIATDVGWVAMVQHYFVGAWIPKDLGTFHLYTRAYNNGLYGVGLASQPVSLKTGDSKTFSANLYAGPAISSNLKQAAPYLDLTIDYGWLWFISEPIFKVMKWVHGLIPNWGWAIIIVTLLIKLIFFPLSAKSYRSMARMRELGPKMKELRERFQEDRQKLSQATMELYRKEKVNPLGGCLPMLIQIPVFIALYWVIIESVEFRQAPFILWIHDLSVKDPYFILPIMMGLSMFLQQRLNPSPPDPMQAKIMMALPVVFTVMFSQFPAGLVLYWFSNNCFSILQQWWITRSVAKHKNKIKNKAK